MAKSVLPLRLKPFIDELNQLLLITIPIFFAQLTPSLMSCLDIAMAGRPQMASLSEFFSPTSFSGSCNNTAAISIASSILGPILVLGNGILVSLTAFIAQYQSREDHQSSHHLLKQSLWLALGLSPILIGLLLACCYWILPLFCGNDPDILRLSTGYLYATCVGIPGYLLFLTLRFFKEGQSQTLPGMLIGFFGTLLTIPMNYTFIYGSFGMPRLEGIGCGVASAIVYWTLFFAMLIYIRYFTVSPPFHTNPLQGYENPNWSTISRIIQVGFPTGMAFFCEVTFFAIVGLFINPLFGKAAISGHEVALNLSSILFTFPMSVSAATAIRVGRALGHASADRARLASVAGFTLGIGLAALTAVITLLFRHAICTFYTPDLQVCQIAAGLMGFAAIYQLSDAVQVVSCGILRGYKDTRIVFIVTLISYWLFGLPIGYILAAKPWLCAPLGPSGFWIGFIIGLNIAALLLSLRVFFLSRLPWERIRKFTAR